MNKTTAMLLVAIMLLLVPSVALASSGSPNPQLPASYEDLLRGMMQQGYGQYQYDPTKPLPLPEVENPSGWGRKATDAFNDNYRSVLSDPRYQFDTKSAIPSAAIQQGANTFDQAAQNYFGQAQSKDTANMAKLLSQKLDMSSAWDFNAIKKSVPIMTASDAKAWATANTPLASGYDAQKSQADKKLEDPFIWTQQSQMSLVPGVGLIQKWASANARIASLEYWQGVLSGKISEGWQNELGAKLD